MVDLYVWKPSLALFRALEWRAAYRYRDLCRCPVLDLGCGDGEIHRLFLGDAGSVGIDVDAAPLPMAKLFMKKVVQGDARQLPFRAGAFGSIVGICAVEHLRDIDTCLTEAARVLRPGGILIATVPSSNWKILYCWNNILSRMGLPGLGRRIVNAHDSRMAHLNLFDPAEWTRRFRQAGFEPVAIDPFLTPRAAWFVTFLESIFEQPFPFPGFWTRDGTFYFMSGILRRIGGKRFWKRIFLWLIRPFYQEEVAHDGIAGGAVLVARKV